MWLGSASMAVIKQGATDYVLNSRLGRFGPVVMRALQGERKIAYFSMEIALESAISTYGGGACGGHHSRGRGSSGTDGRHLLLHRAGHFRQGFDATGWQIEEPAEWKVEQFLTEMPARTAVTIERRSVCLRCWKYQVQGITGYSVPVYLLDADFPENSEWDRMPTFVLYGGDSRYRAVIHEWGCSGHAR